jgi:hypothetical protein
MAKKKASKRKVSRAKSARARATDLDNEPTAPVPVAARADRPKSGIEKRKHPRVPLELLVQVNSASIDEFKAVHARNLSVGGMFIHTSATKPVGAQLYFQFTVKDGGTLIEGLGRVVHTSEQGMGVEFISVLEPSATIIRTLVAARLGGP